MLCGESTSQFLTSLNTYYPVILQITSDIWSYSRRKLYDPLIFKGHLYQKRLSKAENHFKFHGPSLSPLPIIYVYSTKTSATLHDCQERDPTLYHHPYQNNHTKHYVTKHVLLFLNDLVLNFFNIYFFQLCWDKGSVTA